MSVLTIRGKMGLLIKNIFLLLISLFVFSTTNSTTDMTSYQKASHSIVSSYIQAKTQLMNPTNYLLNNQSTFFIQNGCSNQNTNNSFKQKNTNRNQKYINRISIYHLFHSNIKKEHFPISYHSIDYYIYALEKIIT